MTKKRVIAYVMHEHEAALASGAMPDAQITDAYLLGLMEEADIERLRSDGLVIEELPETPAPPDTRARAMTRGATEPDRVRTPRAARNAAVAPPAVLGGRRPRGMAAAAETPRVYLVQLRGPLLDEWRQAVEAAGVTLLYYVPHETYVARATDSQARELAKLPFVVSATADDGSETGTVLTRAALGAELPAQAPSSRGKAIIAYDVLLRDEADAPGVLAWLAKQNVEVSGSAGRKVRLFLLEDSPILDAIQELHEVVQIEEYIPPRVLADHVRTLLGLDAGGAETSDAQPTRTFVETGRGQVVGIADTGLDASHPDFQGRIRKLVARGRANDASDPHGHGTHVSGIALGDGSASAGQYAGIAPEAELVFQSLLGPQNDLSGLPLSLAELFEEAYGEGVRIHNNSWGADTRATYTINATEVDAFVATHRDFLVVIAAGNAGQAARRVNTPAGCVDWLSVGSPATSKNALVVGASRSSRTSGGYAALTYGQVWPQAFPDAPIRAETISGNPDCIAGFSSRGPCDDRRIKPDLVAPGTDIAAPKSSTAPLRAYWGVVPGNDRYAFMGGTSMAAPVVTGCATLVRQYFVEQRQHKPSAALLKAVLLNGTRWLSGADAVEGHDLSPNYHQGFGAVYMPTTLPNAAWPKLRLAFRDEWHDPAGMLARTGRRRRFKVQVKGDSPLRICLAWTDGPHRSLQNNLDLLVEDPKGAKWIGNAKLFHSPSLTDRDNNVEAVRIGAPTPGEYVIQVTAFNILEANQDFALVVTGDLDSELDDY